MPNPLIIQGSLSRIRASITWPAFPSLNVTAPYLGKEGIKLTLQGETVQQILTMTGAVTSPEPYQVAEVEVNLLKSQSLANQYKQQMENNALLGDCTIRPDAVALGVYQLTNCYIKGVRPLDFSGENALFVLTVGGYYLVNATMFG